MPAKKTTTTDPYEPMTGVFPSVTLTDEKLLREAGWLPVLRWVRILPSGAIGEKPYKTGEAKRAITYAAKREQLVAKRKRSVAAKKGLATRKRTAQRSK